MKKTKIEPIYNDTFRKQQKSRKRKLNRWPVFAIVVLFLVITVGFGWHLHQKTILSGYDVKGVQITQNDGYLDFHDLQDSGLKFIYLKATAGATYKDDNFDDNYDRADGTDLKIGISHDFSFKSSADSQYRYIVSQVKNKTGTLPIVIHVMCDNTTTINDNKQGIKLAKLVRLLATHYSQNCVVWATPAVQKKIVEPYVKKSQLMITSSELKGHSKRTMFVQYSGDDKLQVNNKDSRLAPIIYNGSLKSWENKN